MTHKSQGYFGSIAEGFSTLWQSLVVTFRHLYQARKSRTPTGVESNDYFDQNTGIVTLQYPFESFPIPDNGRYRLHNEIEDCIVCDLCAKICPVDCIDITAIKSTEEIGKTSDGTTKRLYAAQFDIDMAKCCYCGLCTTVCPTECLTMTKTYDYSEFDVTNMVYHFTDLSPGEAEKKKVIYEEAQQLKAVAKSTQEKSAAIQEAGSLSSNESNKTDEKKPFKPSIKLPTKKVDITSGAEEVKGEAKDSPLKPDASKPKIVFKPKIAPQTAPIQPEIKVRENEKERGSEGIYNQPIKPMVSKDNQQTEEPIDKGAGQPLPSQPKIVFKPKISIPRTEASKKAIEEKDVKKIANKNAELGQEEKSERGEEGKIFDLPKSESPKPKIVFKPKIPGLSKPGAGTTVSPKEEGNQDKLAASKGEINDLDDAGMAEKGDEPPQKKTPPKPIIKPMIPGIKKPDSDINPKE